MVTSVLPMVASSAAIPEHVVTLTLDPMWSATLFLTALVLTCGGLSLLKNVELRSRRKLQRPARTIAFPRPAGPRSPAIAVLDVTARG